MIYLQKYNERLHKKLIVGWLLGHGLDDDLLGDLPEHGYVAYSDSLPVAAAFLRICEGTMAIIDELISNPIATSADRHHGINDVVGQLIHDSKMRGVKKLIAYSQDKSTIIRSQQHGFMKLPHVLIGLNLGE